MSPAVMKLTRKQQILQRKKVCPGILAQEFFHAIHSDLFDGINTIREWV